MSHNRHQWFVTMLFLVLISAWRSDLFDDSSFCVTCIIWWLRDLFMSYFKVLQRYKWTFSVLKKLLQQWHNLYHQFAKMKIIQRSLTQYWLLDCKSSYLWWDMTQQRWSWLDKRDNDHHSCSCAVSDSALMHSINLCFFYIQICQEAS